MPGVLLVFAAAEAAAAAAAWRLTKVKGMAGLTGRLAGVDLRFLAESFEGAMVDRARGQMRIYRC